MKKYFILFLFIVTAVTAQAQLSNYVDTGGVPIREQAYAGVQGSPYLDDQFANGTLIFSDTDRQKNIPLRYNVYEGTIETLQEGRVISFKKNLIKGCEIFIKNSITQETKRYVIMNGFTGIDDYKEDDFFVVTYQNKVSFITKMNCSLNENAATYGNSSTIKVFAKKEKDYFIKENGEVIPLNRSNSGLIKAIDEKKIKDYIKENKLNVKEDEDLRKVMIFLETII
jgi:hypothetical protein